MLQIISKLILESCTKSTFTASHVLIAAHSGSGLRGRSKFSFTVLKCIYVNLLPYLSNGMLNYSKFHTVRGIPNRKDLKKKNQPAAAGKDDCRERDHKLVSSIFLACWIHWEQLSEAQNLLWLLSPNCDTEPCTPRRQCRLAGEN